MARQDDISKTMAIATEAFAQHVITDAPCQSWHVGAPNGSSIYYFTITWTPGFLTISGDVGEATYEAYGLCPSAASAAAWARTADLDYMTRKSTHKKVYDPYATARTVVRYAYEEFRDGLRDPRRRILHGRDLEDYDRAWVKDSTMGRITGSSTVHSGDFAFRKAVCSALMRDGVSADDAYDYTHDCEVACDNYPDTHHVWHYMAIKFWADHVVIEEKTRPWWRRLWPFRIFTTGKERSV